MAENKPLYIVDASVILKWFLKETEDQEEALLFKAHCDAKLIQLAVPHYAYAEIFNIFVRSLSLDKALAYSSRVLNYFNKEYAITIEMASLAFEIINKTGQKVSFYDAGYHALAIREGGTFVTADEKYYRKTSGQGHIMLLKNYGKKR